MTQNPFDNAPVIFRYTRRQATEDGVLVDLSEWAKVMGFKIPVACTATVWNGYIVPSDAMKQFGQSDRGRAHDVLWMLFVAIHKRKAHSEPEEQLLYEVLFQQEPEKTITVQFKAISGPGDEGEPVLTILMPDED